jgi:hypothetical protein
MDETPSPQKPDSTPGLNKLDLTQLQGFSFGTSWSQDKSAPGGAPREREDRRDERPRREVGGPGGPGAPVRRDRRDFKRPAGSPAPAEGVAPASGDRPARPATGGGERRFERREGGPGGPGGGERPRFERRQGGGEGGPRGDFRGGPREPVGPYVSPHYSVTFYPEDGSFKVLADAIRKSCRTFELFYIARSVVEKNERFIAVVQRIPAGARQGAPAAESALPGVKPAPFFISVPDGIPFETEDAAIAHVLENHLANFFETSEVEVEAPKGNFQVVNRCTITGTLLAPPNYHLYNSILAQHHAANVRMSLEAYKTKVESVRDPEVVAQWLEKMKKATRYTVKPAPVRAPKSEAAAPVAEVAASVSSESPVEPVAEVAPEVAVEAGPDVAPEDAAAAAPAQPEAAAPEAAPLPSFDSLEEARQYLLTEARNRVVRSVEQLRFPGRILETIPANTEIRRAVEGALAAQRRFPLDTANALRGRLRRESFTIFKKGSKGISYVCAVKRRFRVPGQTFSDSLASLIAFIESNPMIKESELPVRLLGLEARPAPVEGAEPVAIPAEEVEKLTKLKGDLRYLVKEGYVTEFVDGALYCAPAMVEARKREIEASDVDPENFPEAPAPKAVEPKPAAPAAEVAAVELEVAALEPEVAQEPVSEPVAEAETAVVDEPETEKKPLES